MPPTSGRTLLGNAPSAADAPLQIPGAPIETLPNTLMSAAAGPRLAATAGAPDAPIERVPQSPRHAARPAANLESAGQSSRMRVGIAALAIALGLVLLLEAVDAPRIARLSLFVPFFLALFGATQALYRTCPGLAARGVREVCGSEEPVARASERQRNVQLARRVVVLSAVGALAATAGFFFVP